MKESNFFALKLLILTCIIVVGCDPKEEFENESQPHDCEGPIVLDESITEEISDEFIDQALTKLVAPKYTDAQLDSIVAYLVDKQGFDPEKIDARDWGITYDGDMGLPVDDILQDMRSEGEVQMRTYRKQPYLVTNTSDINVATIAYGAYALPYGWYIATTIGSNKWDNLNGSLHFSRYHYANYYSWLPNTVWVIPIDFTLIPQLSNNHRAYTFPLNSGSPSRFTLINSSYPNYTSLSQIRKNHLMMHELGHAIGFYHTDTNDGHEILGLPHHCSGNNNTHSVMRQFQNHSSFYDFTSCDKEAYYELY